MRNANHETITDTQSWYKILPLNGFNLIHVKQNLLRRRKRVSESSSSRRKSRKSLTLTVHWNLANGAQKKRRGRLLYCYNSAWMKNGGQIPWNAMAICEMFKTSWQMGKTSYEGRFGETFWGAKIPFGANVEYHPFSSRDQSRLHRFGKKVLLGIFLGYELVAGRIWIY